MTHNRNHSISPRRRYFSVPHLCYWSSFASQRPLIGIASCEYLLCAGVASLSRLVSNFGRPAELACTLGTKSIATNMHAVLCQAVRQSRRSKRQRRIPGEENMRARPLRLRPCPHPHHAGLAMTATSLGRAPYAAGRLHIAQSPHMSASGQSGNHHPHCRPTPPASARSWWRGTAGCSPGNKPSAPVPRGTTCA